MKRLLAILVCAGLALSAGTWVIVLVHKQQRANDAELARFEMGVVGSAIKDYYAVHGVGPPADFDFTPEFRKHPIEPMSITQLTWRIELDSNHPTVFADDYLRIQIGCRSRGGQYVREDFECPLPKRGIRWEWHMRWYRASDWQTEKQCADALAQMVFRDRELFGKWPTKRNQLSGNYLHRFFLASRYGPRLTFRLVPNGRGAGEIAVESSATRLEYRYSCAGPDVDDRVIINRAGGRR